MRAKPLDKGDVDMLSSTLQTNNRLTKPSVRSLLFDNLLTIEELAADMMRSRSAVYQWVRKGLPKKKINGRLYFDASEVAKWLQRKSKT